VLFQIDHIEHTDAAIDMGTPFSCELTNISDGDYDNDGKPNAEDECPDIAAPSPDGDGDGIGDMCDPHPTVAGDCLRVFTDFATPTPRCWRTMGWTYGCMAGDETGWCSPSNSNRTPLQYSLLAPLTYARMTGTIVGIHGPMSAVVMLNDYGQATNLMGDACGVTSLNNNFSTVSGIWTNDVLTSGSNSPMTPTIAYQPAPIVAVRGISTCRGAAAVASTLTSVEILAYPDSVGPFAVHTVNMTFHVEAIAGYNFGGGCN
jgi:hypothetical protein